MQSIFPIFDTGTPILGFPLTTLSFFRFTLCINFKELELGKNVKNELQSIQAKINNVMLNLDLDKRMELAKSILKDMMKSDPKNAKRIDLSVFNTLSYKIDNQRLILEKFLNNKEKYN